MANQEKNRYIGDGVYAEFDGYNIILRVDDHKSEPLVYLESSAMSSLIDFSNECFKKEANHE